MSDSGYIDFIMDKFASLDVVSTKKMFGGNVIHMAGKVLGFVFDDTFLFEPGPTIDALMPQAERRELFPGSKLFVVIDESISASGLCELARACYDDFPISKPRKRKTKGGKGGEGGESGKGGKGGESGESGESGNGGESGREELLKRFPFLKQLKD